MENLPLNLGMYVPLGFASSVRTESSIPYFAVAYPLVSRLPVPLDRVSKASLQRFVTFHAVNCPVRIV